MIINLGSNIFEDCGSAVIVRGHEVFRLRNSPNDEQLLVDFDVMGADGGRIAKVAKNQVVYVADGYMFTADRRQASIRAADGSTVAAVSADGDDTVSVIGTFYVDGLCLRITPTELRAGGLTMSRNVMKDCGAGLVFG